MTATDDYLRHCASCFGIGLYRHRTSPAEMERYIYKSVLYRRENEIRQLFESQFE
jgi:hypothetical protein